MLFYTKWRKCSLRLLDSKRMASSTIPVLKEYRSPKAWTKSSILTSVTREVNKTDDTRPKKANADTDEHTGMYEERNTDNTGQNWNHTNEYDVNEIVDCIVKERQPIFHVRWNKYSPDADTIEADKTIPNHFIPRYWRRQNRGMHCPLWAQRSQIMSEGKFLNTFIEKGGKIEEKVAIRRSKKVGKQEGFSKLWKKKRKRQIINLARKKPK